MKKEVDISVYEVVGDALCVAADDAQKVYRRLASALKEESKVILSFRNVSMLTSAFLNVAIGQLYGEFCEAQIRNLVKIRDMENDDLVLLKRVVDTAKQYFRNPKAFNRAVLDGAEGE